MIKIDFQAKNIQEIFNASKSRYEYITSKIGITPENEEVEGTGRSHLYSFKNLIQFGVAHTASKLGLNPRTVKALLNFLSKSIELEGIGLFNPEIAIELSIHCIEKEGTKFFELTGQSAPEQLKEGGFLTEDYLNVWQYFSAAPKSKAFGFVFLHLGNVDGYITINLGTIKKNILHKIEIVE